MTDQNTVERAFELARSGRTRSIDDLIRSLNKEGHGGAALHLAGTGIRKQLRNEIKAAALKPIA